VCMCVCVCVYVCVCVCIHVGTGALHRPVRHKACRRPHAPLEPRVAGELLWLSVGGRLTGVYQGNVTGQHPAEPSSLCPDCHQVPWTAHHSGADWDLRVVQEFWRSGTISVCPVIITNCLAEVEAY